jgi:hypothetical protein
VIRTTMREKYAAKGEAVTDEFFDSVTHEARCIVHGGGRMHASDVFFYLQQVSTAAMKYALLSVSCTVRTRYTLKETEHC